MWITFFEIGSPGTACGNVRTFCGLGLLVSPAWRETDVFPLQLEEMLRSFVRMHVELLDEPCFQHGFLRGDFTGIATPYASVLQTDGETRRTAWRIGQCRTNGQNFHYVAHGYLQVANGL